MLKGRGGLKFSTKSRYALIVLIDLALRGKGTVRSISEIAETWKIPQTYISQLVGPLRKKGYIASHIGPTGGYTLEADPEKIRVLDIVDLMDGPFSVCNCVLKSGNCPHLDTCTSSSIWQLINHTMREALAGLTLKKLLKLYGVPPPTTRL